MKILSSQDDLPDRLLASAELHTNWLWPAPFLQHLVLVESLGGRRAAEATGPLC